MLHECLQTDVVCEYRLRCLADATVAARGRVGRAWVELGEQESRL